METVDLRRLKGHYIVFDPPVQSVYAAGYGRPERRELRHWPFLSMEATADRFGGDNTTTGHVFQGQRHEVRGITGDLDAPPNYLRPITVHLNAQVAWNHIDLWREPPAYRRARIRHMIRAQYRRRAARRG